MSFLTECSIYEYLAKSYLIYTGCSAKYVPNCRANFSTKCCNGVCLIISHCSTTNRLYVQSFNRHMCSAVFIVLYKMKKWPGRHTRKILIDNSLQVWQVCYFPLFCEQTPDCPLCAVPQEVVKGCEIWRPCRPGLWTTMTTPTVSVVAINAFSCL